MKLTTSTKSFFNKCVRVWKILKKPSKKEFEVIAKVSAIGIVAVGALGFLVSLFMQGLLR